MVNLETIDQLAAKYDEDGYCIARNVLDISSVISAWDEIENLKKHDSLLRFAIYGEVFHGRDLDEEKKSTYRIINSVSRSPLVAELASNDFIVQLLRKLYGVNISCIQSLIFTKSSEQGAHIDCDLVSPPYANPYDLDTLCAAWIPHEVTSEENGALILYPGSHKLDLPSFESYDGNYNNWTHDLVAACHDAGIESKRFIANPGDFLLWHGKLVHAGGVATNKDLTRRSFVFHYGQVQEPLKDRDFSIHVRPNNFKLYFSNYT